MSFPKRTNTAFIAIPILAAIACILFLLILGFTRSNEAAADDQADAPTSQY